MESLHNSDQKWCFECPDCEFSNEELGRLATDDEIHCLLCLRDSGHFVKLKKWLREKSNG